MAHPTRSECSGCGEVFAGMMAFEAHRIGSFRQRTRRCMTGREMQERSLVRNDKGWWTLRLTEEDLEYSDEIADEAGQPVPTS